MLFLDHVSGSLSNGRPHTEMHMTSAANCCKGSHSVCTDLTAASQVQSSQAGYQAHMVAALAGEVLTPHEADAIQVKLTHAPQVLILKPWNAA